MARTYVRTYTNVIIPEVLLYALAAPRDFTVIVFYFVRMLDQHYPISCSGHPGIIYVTIFITTSRVILCKSNKHPSLRP